MKPINVLDLRDTSEIGGPGKTILETYRAIDQSRFRLHLGVFLTRHEKDDCPFVVAARRYGMPVHLVRGFNQYDPRLVTGVARLVKALKIDILHAHEVKSDVIGYLAARLCHVRTVTTLHGWIGNGLKQRVFTAMDRRIVRRFDRVIAVSSQIRSAVDHASGSEVHVLHNAIVVENYRRGPRPGVLDALIGRAPRRPVLVSIGRISREKGHADLVDALRIVARQGHRPDTLLIGDGPEREAVLQRIRAYGLQDWVHAPGYRDGIVPILNEADLLVLPSHTEGLPNAALEALAMEVPVLATRVGGTPEIITDGETGRLVEARAPEALAAAIVDFLNAPECWKATAVRGRALVERQFEFGARTRHLEALYIDLMQPEQSV